MLPAVVKKRRGVKEEKNPLDLKEKSYLLFKFLRCSTMRIQSLEITDFPPIKNLKIENLGNTIIIAGANGSGKTRLKEAIVQTLQGTPLMNLKLKATRDEEKTTFQGEFIEVEKGQQNETLNEYIRTRHFGRGRYVGSLVQIDSDRDIKTIKYNQISWQVTDPDDQATPSTYYYTHFTDRWQNFMNYIHQKVAAHDRKLSEEVKSNPSLTGSDILKKHPYPLERYKDIFHKLLPDKELQDIDPAQVKQFSYKDSAGNILQFNSLSSGEQEVVKVIFDVARKDIKHSVIIVDEPDLHLHPTLTFKLVETLKSLGDHTNQFIFLTHSADLISTYYSTGDVYFIDFLQTGENQAHRLSDLNDSHSELVKLIGENLGLFAVGKKLVFVEGKDSSIDRLTYHAIAQKHLEEAKIISVGSVENITALNSIEQQIRRSIFGINLYMIRDRDGLTDDLIQKIEENGRVKCLKKRHIENYFLDSDMLFKVAKKLYIDSTNPQINQDFIESHIKKIAEDTLKFNLLQNLKEYLAMNHNLKIPTVKSLDTKNTNDIKDEIIKGVADSLSELTDGLDEAALKKWLDVEEVRLQNALDNEEWKNELQGKIIFSKFCGEVFKEDSLKIRQAYVDIALEEKPEVFSDIIEIFKSFS